MNNPGLSPEAWAKFHRMLAASNIKYADQIAEARRKKAEEEEAKTETEEEK